MTWSAVLLNIMTSVDWLHRGAVFGSKNWGWLNATTCNWITVFVGPKQHPDWIDFSSSPSLCHLNPSYKADHAAAIRGAWSDLYLRCSVHSRGKQDKGSTFISLSCAKKIQIWAREEAELSVFLPDCLQTADTRRFSSNRNILRGTSGSKRFSLCVKSSLNGNPKKCEHSHNMYVVCEEAKKYTK